MNKTITKVVCIIVAALFLLGLLAPLGYLVFAEPTEEMTIEELEKQEASAMQILSELEREINTSSEKIYQLEQTMEKNNLELKQLDGKLQEAEQAEAAQKERFRDRFVASCERGGGYLELLLSAESFSDFIDKLVIARELAEYDKSVLGAMEQVTQEIQTAKKSQEDLQTQQNAAKSQLETERVALQKKSADVIAYIEKLKADKASYEQYLKEKEAAEQSAKARAGISNSGTGVASQVSVGEFLWPTNTRYITSPYEPNRVNPVTGQVRDHTGTDIGAMEGAPVWAAKAGKVILSEYNGGYGNCVILQHENGVTTLYGHMSAILVQKGATVQQGQQIGRIGSTGNSTGPHLHFEVLINGTPVDPMGYF